MATALSERTAPIQGPMPLTPEWYARRSTCIGASEAAAACGVSPYRQPLDVYLEKRGLVDPIDESEAMRMGKVLEPIVLKEYQRRRFGEVVLYAPTAMLIHHTMPFIAATPDGMARVVSGTEMFPVDAKTTTFRRAHEFGEEGSDELPADYVMQAQQQMFVTGADRQDTAVLLDGRTLRVYTVHRHDGLIDGLVSALTELWQRIQNGDPPEPNWEHPHTPELVKGLFGTSEARTVELSGTAIQAWERQRELGEQMSAIKAEREKLRALVAYEIGNAAGATIPGGTIERKQVNRKGYTVEATSYFQLTQKKEKA